MGFGGAIFQGHDRPEALNTRDPKAPRANLQNRQQHTVTKGEAFTRAATTFRQSLHASSAQ